MIYDLLYLSCSIHEHYYQNRIWVWYDVFYNKGPVGIALNYCHQLSISCMIYFLIKCTPDSLYLLIVLFRYFIVLGKFFYHWHRLSPVHHYFFLTTSTHIGSSISDRLNCKLFQHFNQYWVYCICPTNKIIVCSYLTVKCYNFFP